MTLDLDRNRRISALLKAGDGAKAQGSAECVAYYHEALQLAKEGNDVLRGGEAALALARAHSYVASVRDYELAETFATSAVKSGEEFGLLGRDLAVRAKLTLGNIITDSFQAQRPANAESRLESAMRLFKVVIGSDEADEFTKASARNGLGTAKVLGGDYAGAAQDYLAASSEYEAIDNLGSMLMAQSNAALSFYNAQQFDDARSVAETGLDMASTMDAPNQACVSRLTQVLEAANQALASQKLS